MNRQQPLPRPCPVCGGHEAETHLQKAALRLARCRRCSMIYANPAPPDFASGQYYRQAGAHYYLAPAKLQSDYSPVRFERELRLFRRHCPTGAVLDVGCSTGAFLWQLNQRFPGSYRLTGTDLSGPPLDYAESRGIPVIRDGFLQHDFAGQSFDAVTFWAVLEHLLEPRRFVEKAASLLKPHGLCFVLTPNQGSLAARLLGARYRYLYPQHLNYFTPHTLGRLVQPSFSILESRSLHFNPLVIWQDWLQGAREVTNAERAELLKRTTTYKRSPWLAPVRLAYRLAERILGASALADNIALVLRPNPGPLILRHQHFH